MALRVRKDAWSAAAASDLQWYGRAVTAMKGRPATDPRSWAWQGAIHGYNPNTQPWPSFVNPPQQGNPFWEQCQHQTWFFLPWHRGYLAYFEDIVAATVVQLGGPANWALPYWNYSDSGNRNARRLPRPFVGRRLQNGSDNPLWAPRRTEDPNWEIPVNNVSLAALNIPVFAGSASGGEPGFGGVRTDFSHFGQVNGRLENVPHNVIHGAVGGAGWMSNPNTAALDPIFWLHHANIDRLWQVWRNRPGHLDPAEARWLTGTTFRLHNAQGQPVQFTARDMVDTRRILQGYVYDHLRGAFAMALEASMLESVGDEEPVETGPAELAGASDTSISIEGGRASTRLSVRPEASSAILESVEDEAAPPRRAYLNIENVTGTAVGANYRIVVTPEGGDPIDAGLLSTFGVASASEEGDSREGQGITTVIDVTDIVNRLTAAGDPVPELEVTFERDDDADDALLESVGDDPATLKVGRVSLYYS